MLSCRVLSNESRPRIRNLLHDEKTNLFITFSIAFSIVIKDGNIVMPDFVIVMPDFVIVVQEFLIVMSDFAIVVQEFVIVTQNFVIVITCRRNSTARVSIIRTEYER